MEPGLPDVFSQGILKEIRYEYSGGSMEFGTEFLADVTAEELVEGEYWPQERVDEICRVEHRPITTEDWQNLVKSTDQLRAFMVKRETPVSADNSGEELFVLDGGDYQNLYLTLELDDQTETFSYIIPQDRRFTTLRTLLYELVDPQGREIIWYEAPEIAGIWFRNEKKGYSYQCTKFEGDKQYVYRAYWTERGSSKSLRTEISEETWQRIKTFCEDNQMMDLPAGSRSETGGTLYLSDGRQYGFTADRKQAERFYAFFSELTGELNS